MKKTIEIESNYFEDSRIQALINDMLMTGLGLYFAIRIIVESSENGILPLKYVIDAVCKNGRRNRCIQVIRNYSLFDVDEFGLIHVCALTPACASPACVTPTCASPAQNNNNNFSNKKKNKELDIVYVGESKKFKKPTIEEISAYCQQRQNNIDPVKFFHFYEARGWKVGKDTMKNWKSAIITWERNNESPTPTQPYQKISDQRSALDPFDGFSSQNPDLDCQPIPENAPPKPSPTAQWNYATDSWSEFY